MRGKRLIVAEVLALTAMWGRSPSVLAQNLQARSAVLL